MSEVKENVETANAPALIANAEGKMLDVQDLIKQVNAAEVGMELTSDYIKWVMAEEVRLLFVEMGTMKKINGEDGETVPAAKFLAASDGKLKICGDVVLVSFGQGLAAKGQTLVPLAITYIADKGKAGNKYRDFSIKSLLL